MRSTLILGDGNFSFSNTFCSQLEEFALINEMDLQLHVVCSSFDSLETVTRKYPEAEQKLKELQQKHRRQWISLCHEVDATRIAETLGPRVLLREFDDIIFNFPHLGFEDIRAHQCLLAHIINSAKSVLAPTGSITIALAESQGRSWAIEDIAQRLGFKCIEKLPIMAADWPGYEMKRHHTGKSFQSRVQSCYHYIFRVKENFSEATVTILQILQHKRQERKTFINENKAVYSGPAPTARTTSVDGQENKKTKKRKVHQLVEGMYCLGTTALDGSDNNNNKVENSTRDVYICNVCGRQFPTEQGVITHAYNVHVLSGNAIHDDCSCAESMIATKLKATGSFESNPPPEFYCQKCERSFTNADALNQHRIAKHAGLHLNLHATRGKHHVDEESLECDITTELICRVCLCKFASVESHHRHQEKDFIPVDASFEFTCSQCQKRFNEERAWKQHMNFCSMKK